MVKENAEVGTFVAHLSVSDADSNANGEFSCNVGRLGGGGGLGWGGLGWGGLGWVGVGWGGLGWVGGLGLG